MNLEFFLKNKQFLSLAGNVVMAALNLITSAILYRYLSKSEMGCWILFQAVFILIDTFRTGFLQTAFIKFYAGANENRAINILGSTWYLGVIITVVVVFISMLGFFILSNISDAAIIAIIKWTGFTFISTLPIVMATWILQAEQRYLEILYIRLINQASFIIFILAYIIGSKITLDIVLFTNFLSCVLTCILIFICGWAKIKTVTKQTTSSVKEIYHFGKYSLGTSISSNLLRSSDSFIINFTLGKGSLAIYNIAQNLLNIIDIPLRSFVATAITSLSAAQNKNNKQHVEYIFKKYTGTLTILFIPVAIGVIIFADLAVKFIGGEKYIHTPAANILRIFMVFAIFFPIDKFVGVTLDVIHQPKINFYKVLLMLGLNIAGDFAGIYFMHNVYGIGIASIPTFLIGTLFGYLFLKKFLHINFYQSLKLGYNQIVNITKPYC